ncbi:MAG: polyprenyl synthetase family protein [Rubrivivax sp.]|nr:polyprenyl synthetase family protein [Rubrivivax sp.]
MQQTRKRIEEALAAVVSVAETRGAPPQLGAAIRHAVLPGGARIRPLLCVAVAAACGDSDPTLSLSAGVSIELIHCASLVHDDLPCFDDAPLRRGLPSVHAAYGERQAVLAGDALIVMAFEVLAQGAAQHPERLCGLVSELTQRTGMPRGIVAGQAWECEDWVALPDYQRAKTGSLFAAASVMGALASGGDAERWRAFGERLGEAYQVADDIRDAACTEAEMGKPALRDRALGRPSVVIEMGMSGALDYFEQLLASARSSVPECRGAPSLRALVGAESERLLPAGLRASALAVA